MIGIAGYVCIPSHVEVAARMAERFGSLRTTTPFHLAHSTDCAFAASTPDHDVRACDRLYRAPDGTLVAIDGEVFGLESHAVGPNVSKLALFYERYRKEGHALLRRIRGAFSIAMWEPHTRTLTLITDPHGLRSLYVVQRGRVIAFGSRVRSVLAALDHPPEVDEDGLSDFILLGMPMGQKTLFRGISLVPAATVMTFAGGETRSHRYEELIFARTDQSPETPAQACERLCDAFLDAGAEQMGSGHAFNVPLSGGLDSRIVAALAARFATNVSTHTIGDADSPDLRLAPRVARSLGLPNESWVVKPEDWIRSVEESVYRTDGMYNPMDAQIMALARRLGNPKSITLDGTSSLDGLFRFFEPMLHRFLPEAISYRQHGLKVPPDALFDARGELSFEPLKRSAFARYALHRARNSVSEMVESVPSAAFRTPFDAMDYMDQLHRVRRFNMMGTVLLRNATEVRHPFFDRRVLEVIRGLKGEHRSREKMVLGLVLRRLSPAAARVPYERTGMPADVGATRHALRYAKLAVSKLVGAPNKRVTAVIDYRRWCREEPEIQGFIRDVLGRSDSESAKLLGRSTVDAILTDSFSAHGSGAVTFLMGRMLAYEIWYRSFVRAGNAWVHAAE